MSGSNAVLLQDAWLSRGQALRWGRPRFGGAHIYLNRTSSRPTVQCECLSPFLLLVCFFHVQLYTESMSVLCGMLLYCGVLSLSLVCACASSTYYYNFIPRKHALWYKVVRGRNVADREVSLCALLYVFLYWCSLSFLSATPPPRSHTRIISTLSLPLSPHRGGGECTCMPLPLQPSPLQHNLQ